MSTIVKEVVIPEGDRMCIEVELPAGIPVGKAIMTITLEPKDEKGKHLNRAAEIFGQGKGKIWMADDFDARLEDFAEYM